MLITLIQKEMMHHILSARFVALLLMCVLLIPLNFHINYRRYLQRQVDYQETVKKENNKDPAEQPWKQRKTTDPNLEVSKLILKPTPLSVFATGLESALPNSLGMTRNGIKRGEAALSTASTLCSSSVPSSVCSRYCLPLMQSQAKEKLERFG